MTFPPRYALMRGYGQSIRASFKYGWHRASALQQAATCPVDSSHACPDAVYWLMQFVHPVEQPVLGLQPAT